MSIASSNDREAVDDAAQHSLSSEQDEMAVLSPALRLATSHKQHSAIGNRNCRLSQHLREFHLIVNQQKANHR
jgi:hypothetical protein